MRTALKIFFAIIVLLIITIIAIPFFVNPNDYKGEITTQVEKATGRKLTFGGDLKLSVFPWIALELGPTTLSNAKGFSPDYFAKVKNAEIRVKLLPLLSQKVELDTIVLDGLSLNLQTAKNGKNNWTFATSTSTPSNDTTPTKQTETTNNSRLAAISIAGVKITNANILYSDASKGQSYQINNFNLNVAQFSSGESTPLDMTLDIISKKPQLITHITLASDVMADMDNQSFSLKNLVLTSAIKGDMLPSGSANIKLTSNINADLKQQTVNIPNLTLAMDKLLLTANIKANHVMSKPAFSGSLKLAAFNPKELAAALNIALPAMADNKALTKLALSTQLQGTADSVQANQVVVKLDDSQLTGDLGVSHFAKPMLNFALKLDQIDADRYMPETKTVSNTTKTTNNKSTASAASATGSDKLPLEPLRQINAKGTFDIGKLKINNLKVQNIHVALNAANGLVKLPSLTAQLYKGSFSGNTTLDARSSKLKVAINETLKGLQAEPLFKDLAINAPIVGTTNMNSNLTLSGTTVNEMKKTLNGKGAFSFTNGAVKGINIAESIREAEAVLRGKSIKKSKAPRQTDFALLKGSFTTTNGTINNPDLLVKSPLLRINGAGTASLPTEKLNYTVNTSIVNTATGEGGKDLKDLTKLTIPVKITGSFSNPKPSVDLESLLKQNASKKIKGKADKQIDKLLGNSKGADSAKKLLHSFF